MGRGNDWWRPSPGSKWEQRIHLVGATLSIVLGSLTLASITWSLASTADGRIKALLWWCYGVSAAGAFVVFSVQKREHKETRFARALGSTHLAHHKLRDAAYERYIGSYQEQVWKQTVQDSLREFAAAFSVATGAPCHATIKTLIDPRGASGRSSVPPDELIVDTYVRSGARKPRVRAGVPANSVGRNTDFRQLFSPDADNRCWYQNDLLAIDPVMYENPHWPENPTRRNVPYRSTMVWPIRKVVREGTDTTPHELYIHGFLTVDSREADIFDYDRHFDLGAAYADHLLSVLWNPEELRQVHNAVFGEQGLAVMSDAAMAISSQAEQSHES